MKNSSFAEAGDIGSHGGPNTTYEQHRFLWPLAHWCLASKNDYDPELLFGTGG